MKTTSQSPSPSLSQSPSLKIKSLIFLVDEPDEHLYINIANAIVACGDAALPLLKEKLDQTTEPYVQERLKYLIDTIERQDVVNKLNSWHDKREYDLLEPYFILSKYKFPQSDWNDIGFQIIMIIEQVEKELNYNLTPLEQVKILNHIIYDINRFRGDKVAVSNKDYYYVNKLLETHIGNPFSLGMLY